MAHKDLFKLFHYSLFIDGVRNLDTRRRRSLGDAVDVVHDCP